MTAKETHTNKTILRVIIAGVILLLAAGAFCGAASAYRVEVDNTDVHVGDSVTLTICDAYSIFDEMTMNLDYFSGDRCFGNLPKKVSIPPHQARVPVTLEAITTGSCDIALWQGTMGTIVTPKITVRPKTCIEFYNGTTKIGETTGREMRTLELPAAPTGTGTFFGWRVGSPAGDFFSLYQNSQHVLFIDSPYYDSSKNWIYNEPTLKLYAAWGEAAPMPASYTVTAAAGTGGSITDAPTSPVAAGDTVTLTAAAESGYHFKQWESISGLPFSTSTDNPLAFYMPNGPVSVTASFDADPTPSPSQTVIFLDANGGDSSTTNVTATKGSADLSGSITPPAKTGYTFAGFFTAKTDGECVIDTTGALQNSTAYTDADGNWDSDANTITLYAQWTDALYSLTTAAGTGGTITPEPGESQAAFGQQVTLTATAGTGYHFRQWTLTGLPGTSAGDNPLIFNMPAQAVTVTAVFEEDTPAPANHSITVATGVPGGSASATYANAPEGTEITINAYSDAGYKFSSWTVTGAMVSSPTANPATFTVESSDVTVTPVFEEDTPAPPPTAHSITVQSSGKGGISASASSAKAGDTVVLAKLAGDGYQFIEWQVAPGTLIIGDDNTFTMPDEPVSVTAVFEIISKTVPAKEDGTAEIYSATVPFSGRGEASVITATNIDEGLTFKAKSETSDILQRTGYTQTILSVFEIEVTSFKHPDLPSELTIDVRLADESLKEYVCLEHYTGTAWEKILPKKRDNTGDSHTFRYVFELTSYSPIGVVIEVPQSSPTPHKSSSSQAPSVWLTEPVAAEQPTVTPTPAPTPAAAPTPDVPTVKPVATETPASPAPFMGILAGLGAAAVVLSARRK